MSVIPFISNYAPLQRAKWVDALQLQLSEHTVCDFSNCSEKVKHFAEVCITADPDPKAVLSLPKLVWVQSLWAGVEALLSNPDLDHIPLVRLIDPSLAARMSEAALAWCLYLHRDMPAYQAQQNNKIWLEHALVSAEDRHVAVLGCGELGLAAASRLQQNHFDVSTWSRSPKKLNNIEHYHGEHGLTDLLVKADIVVLLLPLTAQTKHIINAQRLSLFKSDAAIINFGRGPLIDHQALLQELDTGTISHAVLDVFDQEPLPEDSRLWSHPKITVLPHISAQTNIKTASKIAAKNIENWFKSGEKPNVVNRSKGY